MIRLMAATVVLSLLSGTLGAATPMLRMVDPPRAAVEGGTLVTVRGTDLYPDCPITCPPFRVLIGGVEATVVAATNEAVTFTAPPHAAGRFDLVVDTGTGAATLPGGFEFVTSDNALREKVLVPIIYDGPAAEGSLWETELAVRNDGTSGVDGIFEIYPSQETVPPVPVPIPPQKSFFALIDGGREGRMFYPKMVKAPDLTFHLRIRDVSRVARDAGTMIPVVRESDFLRGTVHLLNIPVTPDFRHRLRIYSPDAGAPTTVRLRVLRMSGDALVSEQNVELRAPRFAEDGSETEFPRDPGYAEIPLTYPDDVEGPVRIEVAPTSSLQRLWAFLSITHNETQHVTLVAPR